MADPKQICRLCKGTENLYNMCIDGDTCLLDKTNFCINLNISQNDGLPTMICKCCKKMIKKFFKFKQNCLKVDSELRFLNESKDFENDYLTDTQPLSIEDDSFNIHSEDVLVTLDVEDIDISKFSSENFLKILDNSTQDSIICEVCGSIYDSNSDYRAHLSSHNATRLYQCQFCAKCFTRAESRENHMRAHLGIRPFICEICGRSSTKRQDLIRHMKIHSDERNHVCNICGRRFKRGMDLTTHNRTHTGARPYKCANCYKEYTSHSGLRNHRKLCTEPVIPIETSQGIGIYS